MSKPDPFCECCGNLCSVNLLTDGLCKRCLAVVRQRLVYALADADRRLEEAEQRHRAFVGRAADDLAYNEAMVDRLVRDKVRLVETVRWLLGFFEFKRWKEGV